MRIRIVATEPEARVWVERFREVFDVREASTFRPWTRQDPQSTLGAVYVDAELKENDKNEVVRAQADRLDRRNALAPTRRAITGEGTART